MFKSPTVKIIAVYFLVYIFISIVFAIYLFIRGDSPLGALAIFLFLPFSVINGPYMGITHPTFETSYSILLILCLFLTIVGFKYRKNILGQSLAVVGMLGWSFLGLLGFGTAT